MWNRRNSRFDGGATTTCGTSLPSHSLRGSYDPFELLRNSPMRPRRFSAQVSRRSGRCVGAIAMHGLWALWFTLSSMGFPGGALNSTTQAGTFTNAASPGSQCGCSLQKRLAGNCCCKQSAVNPATRLASCCAKPSPAKSACCIKSKPTPAEVSYRSPVSRILAIESCDCGSAADHDRVNHPQPRLPAVSVVVSIKVSATQWIAPLSERGQGERNEPPTPPPRSDVG